MIDHEQARDFLHGIAKNIGKGWTFNYPDCGDRGVLHPEGVECYGFIVDMTSDRDYLIIYGRFQRALDGSGYGLEYNEKMASIRVSRKKTVKQIANDICRRLLPVYEEQYQRNYKYVTQVRELHEKRINIDNEVRLLLYSYANDHPDKPYVYYKVHHDASLTLNIANVSLSDTEKILNLLRKSKRGDHYK